MSQFIYYIYFHLPTLSRVEGVSHCPALEQNGDSVDQNALWAATVGQVSPHSVPGPPRIFDWNNLWCGVEP